MLYVTPMFALICMSSDTDRCVYPFKIWTLVAVVLNARDKDGTILGATPVHSASPGPLPS